MTIRSSVVAARVIDSTKTPLRLYLDGDNHDQRSKSSQNIGSFGKFGEEIED
jgi:hypothetical protein